MGQIDEYIKAIRARGGKVPDIKHDKFDSKISKLDSRLNTLPKKPTKRKKDGR